MTKDEFLINLKSMFQDIQNLTEYQIDNIHNWVLWVEQTECLPQVGDIVQIHPEFGDIFGGHLLVITEVYGWGVKGYVMYLKKRKDFFFKTFHYKETVPCGKARWYINEPIKDETCKSH